MNSKILKGIALANFALLLFAFLLYRGSYFDKYFHNNNHNNLTSPNGGIVNTTKKDSIPNSSHIRKQRLSSSKSAIIIDNFEFDTVQLKVDSTFNKSEEKPKRILYSSKSGIIFESKPSSDSFSEQRKKNKKKE